MTHNIIYVKFLALAALFAVIVGAALPARADNLNNQPWGFNNQNRASIAALMNTVEHDNNGNGPSQQVGGSITNLVCGNGADSSTATGNSACIILNNSAGSNIGTDQDTTGDQTADNTQTQTTTVNETINGPTPPEDLTDVLEGLGNDN